MCKTLIFQVCITEAKVLETHRLARVDMDYCVIEDAYMTCIEKEADTSIKEFKLGCQVSRSRKPNEPRGRKDYSTDLRSDFFQ